MELEQILSEKLTNDKTVEAVESNYRGLIKVKGIERDIEQERLIKLNRLERKEEPQEVKTDCLGRYCPKCSRRITEEVEKYCTRCGQRLKNP